MRGDNRATDRLFTEPTATMLADKRKKARQKGRRLVYDCRNNEVQDDRVRCRKGLMVGPADDGTMSLIQVLKGIAPPVCRECEDYLTWDEPETD